MNRIVLISAALAAIALDSSRLRAQSLAGDSAREWTLARVLAAAGDNHPLVEAARARVSSAEGSRRSAGAFANPLATYQLENAAFPGQRSPLSGIDRELSAFVTLPLEPLFQRGPRIRRANEDVRAATASLALAKRQVQLDAARGFYAVATAQAVVDEAVDAYGNLERLAAFNRTRVREGATAEGDLMRVEVEVGRASTLLTLARVDLNRARAALAPYLGAQGAAELADSVRVVVPAGTDQPSPASPLPSVATLTHTAIQRRPELVAARARAASAVANVALQRTLTVRQLGATFGNKRIGSTNSMIAGITVPLPIFDRNGGEIQRARGERTAAEKEVMWEERRVEAELQSAHRSAELLAAQLAQVDGTGPATAITGLLARAQASLDVTLRAYAEGAASLLQLLDALGAFRDARLTYFRLLHAQRASLIELAVAAGEEPTTYLSNTSPTSGTEDRKP